METRVRDIGTPGDLALLGDPGFRDGTFRRLVLWENGFLWMDTAPGPVLENALEQLGKPGVAVQAALRKTTDPAGGAGDPGKELVVMIRRHHEPDIRTVIRARERAERAAAG